MDDNLRLTLAALALLEAIALYVWRYRREPGALPLAGFQVAKMIWLWGRLEAGSAVQAQQWVFWMDAGMLASLGLSYAGFRFLAEIWGLERKARRRLDGANLALIAAFAAVMLTNRWHHAFWRLPAAGSSAVKLAGGPVQGVWLFATIALNLLYLVLTAAWALRERGLRRRQVQMFLLAIVLSWAAVLASWHPAWRLPNPLPIGFMLSSLVMTWAFIRWRVLGLLPLAQETVLNQRIDGLLMLDLSGRIVLLNQAARALFPTRNLAEGDSFAKAVDDWPALAAIAECPGECQFDAARQFSTRAMTYEVALTPLRNAVGHSLGRVVTFKDVTEERREQSRKLEQGKAKSMLEERQRLGRELHDGGQIWYFLATQTQTVQYLLEHNQIERALQIVRRMIQVQAERTFGMRESMLGLLSDLSEEHELPQAIEEQLDWYRHYCEMDARLTLETAWEPGRISLPEQAQLLRIAQEALANARKHATARSVRVGLNVQREKLTLSIADDGCGFSKETAARIEGHFGMKTMRERAESIGARFELVSEPGAGCRIAVELPLA
jgi:signal transduction histidine kinase